MRWPPLSEATVVAGEAGLDREVSWPTMLRVRPPAFEPLSGHELALVSIEALHLLDESLTLTQLIGRLAERDVAGVVVVGPVDAAAIARADRTGLPLLRLPESYHYAELGPAVSRVIGEQRTRLYQLGLDVHRQLVEVSLGGRGLDGIVRRLADVAGRRAVLLDIGAELLARATPLEFPADPLDDELPEIELLRTRFAGEIDARAEPPTARVEVAGGAALAAPVVVRDVIAAFLCLLGDEFSDDDQVALARGCQVCALELAKQEAVTEAERRLRGGFFDDLLEGSQESVEALIARGRRLGYDLLRPYVMLALSPDGPGTSSPRFPEALERVTREAAQFLQGRRATGLVTPRRDLVAVFLGAEGAAADEPARRFGEELRDYLSGPVGISVSIGLGGSHPGLPGLRRGFQEAAQASQIGREFFGPGQVTAYPDLGVYRLLYAFRTSEELRTFCQETLGPLLEYDEKNSTAYVETLDAFFQHDASLRAAADALFLHRNSLAYRLKRISEISGFNLDSLEDRFRLQLALKGRRLVRSSPELAN
ncbi:MAG TPA: helix-turn-helix domain-containing protein [Chloroflexota bacterium]|nr:helix-turn-helix domain-containing protein [Chloroflexota bacterium]